MSDRMNRTQYRQWYQHNINLPVMPWEEYRRRQESDLDLEIMVCECFFYSGYQLPLDAWCEYCLGIRPHYKGLKVYKRKIPSTIPDYSDYPLDKF